MSVRGHGLIAALLAGSVALACEPRAADEPQADAPPPATESPRADTAPARPQRLEVTVFFTRGEEPVPVTREIPHTPAVLRGALEMLIAGPTEREREAGISSWFSAETAGMLLDVSLEENGLAVVDFQDFSRIVPGASSAAGSRILLNELNSTVFQFEEVEAVRYRFAGDCDAFWNWLQRACTTVTRGDHLIG